MIFPGLQSRLTVLSKSKRLKDNYKTGLIKWGKYFDKNIFLRMLSGEKSKAPNQKFLWILACPNKRICWVISDYGGGFIFRATVSVVGKSSTARFLQGKYNAG